VPEVEIFRFYSLIISL